MIDYLTDEEKDLLSLATNRGYSPKTDLLQAETYGLVRRFKNRKPVLTKAGQKKVRALIRDISEARESVILGVGIRAISSKRYREVFNELVEEEIIRAPTQGNRWVLTRKGNREVQELLLKVEECLKSL